jgi:2-keto-3-deoxy-L-rhamnonate aldolase RhmA
MNRLKDKILHGQLTLGSWITLAHPAIAEIMAQSGFDWLVVDLEHSVITIRETEELIRVIELSGVTPLVRLTSNNPDQIKRIMDAGSHGIIVPMVNSALEAERAVQAIKYPSRGNRGFSLARAHGYGSRFKEYLEWEYENTIVIVQIEHIDAVNNLESILTVDGVDGYIIGLYDLSGSMGIPGQFDHHDLIDAMETIQMVASKLNKTGGIHIVEPDIDDLRAKISDGHRFIAYSLDIRMLDTMCRVALESFKGLGE